MADNDSILISVAILGGTGKEGTGLAKRWALHGYRVLIGSRDADKAQQRAAELNAELGGDYLVGMSNADAATQANLVILSVPYSAHRSTLLSVRDQLQGKILIDITVPLVPPFVRAVTVPEGKSAALEAAALLGESVRVVSAFQNVSSDRMRTVDEEINCDVLVTSDDDEAKKEVIELVKAAGMRGIDAGPLANSVAAEAITPVLLYINKKYGVKAAGIRITNLEL